jgi:hypothetical protein
MGSSAALEVGSLPLATGPMTTMKAHAAVQGTCSLTVKGHVLVE